jgi:hypothetical protein
MTMPTTAPVDRLLVPLAVNVIPPVLLLLL